MHEISVVLSDDNPEAGIASKCFKNFSVLIFYGGLRYSNIKTGKPLDNVGLL
jgi:hypothetical protein